MSPLAPLPARRPFGRDLLLLLALLAAVLFFLFSKSFSPDLVLFSNDAPLGLIRSQAGADASTFDGLFTGYWSDLNWIGIEPPSVLPDLSFGVYQIFGGAVANAKFYVPVSLLFLGFAAWFFFRQLGFGQSACVIAGLAAALNMNTFSHACWGLPGRALTLGCSFLALAALQSGLARNGLLKACLAGLAVATGIMEGFDVGALFSLYVAAFAMFLGFAKPGPVAGKIANGVVRMTVVALAAALFAAAALSTLIGTQIKGVAGLEQTDAAREKRWVGATMWSLPKIETFRLVIPGLFGYRMDTDQGGSYWGAVGQEPGVPQSRHSGAGEYAGCLVVLLALWAAIQGFRKNSGVFSLPESRFVRFWAVLAVVALLFAWGRHAPFYRLIYPLPYFSTIRNPIKFMHLFHLCLLILFGFGLEATLRACFRGGPAKSRSVVDHLKAWWKSVSGFDRKWAQACVGCLGMSVLFCLVYTASTAELERHLNAAGFAAPSSGQIAKFSQGEVRLFVLFFALSVGAALLCLSGWFAGPRAKWAVLMLGSLVVVDLARANLPWIVYYDYKDKYASNPVIDFLREKSHEHRVAYKVAPLSSQYLASDQDRIFAAVWSEWLQSLFQYYNVQSTEIIQMPRTQELDQAYMSALFPQDQQHYFLFFRLWQLSNTKYLIGQNGVLPKDQGFNVVTNFDIVLKNPAPGAVAARVEDFTTQFNPKGRYAIFEFPAALPRALLLPKWTSTTNDQQVLRELGDPAFDPKASVFVSGEAPLPAPSASTNQPAGKVDFVRYAPKEIELKSESPIPTILLLNDRYSPHWHVWVDGKESPLLRCNYIMRGVALAAGTHKIEFKFRPPTQAIYLSLAAFAGGMCVAGFLAVSSLKRARAGAPAPKNSAESGKP